MTMPSIGPPPSLSTVCLCSPSHVDLPALEEITLGQAVFACKFDTAVVKLTSTQAPLLSLTDMPSLYSFKAASGCFEHTTDLLISSSIDLGHSRTDTPELKVLDIPNNSFLINPSNFSIFSTTHTPIFSIDAGAFHNHITFPQQLLGVNVTKSEDLRTLPCKLEELIIGNGCCNDFNTSVSFDRFVQLRRLVIGDNCFTNATMLLIKMMQTLQEVSIGNYCFSAYEGIFELSSCPKLTKVHIGFLSFEKYQQCIIESTFSDQHSS